MRNMHYWVSCRGGTSRFLRLAALSLLSSGIVLVGASREARAERGDACRYGACGAATFKFVGKNRLENINMSVADHKCDGNPVYIRLRVFDSNGAAETQKRFNHKGCGGEPESWSNLHWDNGQPIRGVRVRVCVQRNNRPDNCSESDYIDNPNT